MNKKKKPCLVQLLVLKGKNVANSYNIAPLYYKYDLQILTITIIFIVFYHNICCLEIIILNISQIMYSLHLKMAFYSSY